MMKQRKKLPSTINSLIRRIITSLKSHPRKQSIVRLLNEVKAINAGDSISENGNLDIYSVKTTQVADYNIRQLAIADSDRVLAAVFALQRQSKVIDHDTSVLEFKVMSVDLWTPKLYLYFQIDYQEKMIYLINVVNENTYLDLKALSNDELALWIMECLSGE